MFMLLLVDSQNGNKVSGTHIQWCCACNLIEAEKRARETENANSNRISVAVVDELYDSYSTGKYYKNLDRLDRRQT